MEYIAHIRSRDGKIQTVSEHSEAVRAGCEHFGVKAGVPHLAGLSGILHDLGKRTPAFQRYIQQAVSNPGSVRRGDVDHSTAGGKLVFERYHQRRRNWEDRFTAEWIGNCIISHHQGLRDFIGPEGRLPFLERVRDKQLEGLEEAAASFFSDRSEDWLDAYFEKAKTEMQHAIEQIQRCGLDSNASSLLLKYIFSCLIDADRTDTRQFEENEESRWEEDRSAFFARSYDKLLEAVTAMEQAEDAGHPINVLRRKMSQQCDKAADRPSDIYTLSIPTGGGKTLSSLRYALKHAKTSGKDRIIYVVPFTTIIEQNAQDIRDILQEDDMILEHHSNIVDARREDEVSEEYDIRRKNLRLARDNWDRPIIFTTMVQFLNACYGLGTRNARRMHRLANAVIIFDEVQAVPPKCVSLFNAALNFLKSFGRSSMLLCTATQPALDFVRHHLHIAEQAEIISNLSEVGEDFKRVEVVDRVTARGWNSQEIAAFIGERLRELDSTLVILNTKSAVRKLYKYLKEELVREESGVRLFHLSTSMCAAHRKAVLAEIKEALRQQEKVICISTQLIEAGVNISFDCVIRSLAGLDSIAQAAGRCNRHGKDPLRHVYIIRASEERLTSLPDIRIGAEKTALLLADFRNHPERYAHNLLSPAAIQSYFQSYYSHIKTELDYYVPKLDLNLYDLLGTNKKLFQHYKNKQGQSPQIHNRAAFATAEQHFEVIANAATSVIVPYNEEARQIMIELNGELEIQSLGELLRRAQPYTVNLYNQDLKQLERSGELYPVLNGNVLALRETAYREEFGVDTAGEGVWDAAII
ncbi:CRISPR-associated helicase Cas3' [Paenibacillus spiritus]|uniref:CRISPR-associated helicase Cas3 n=1 Tax=Paenibacillus spiritus TaxID=2496557 RepID=A0A5J5GA85_9BACL|nr:CRISPR-associated helicase Cas3' [Paenibacillus spiritus]KAA9004891.1 CRISPR-associated helicase Cas3' [Paenibacillus spiritus]